MPLKLNSTSGGSVTLQEPTTASNRTLTLPDATGTVIYSDASGNVGIGTSSPSYQLHTVGSTDGNITNGVTNSSSGASAVSRFIALSDAGSAIFGMTSSAYTGITGAQDAMLLNANSASGGIAFALDGVLKSKIDSSGNMLVGDTATVSGARLVVKKSNSERVIHVENTQNLSGDQTYRSVLGTNCNNTSSYHFVATTGSDKCYIYGNGNLVNSNNSYGALSDISIKENVVDATPKLADIMQVRVRNYNLKDDENKTKQIGVVAQELEEIFPGMIETDGISGHKQVKYSVFVPMLIKAIQEQQVMIEELKAKVAALEAK